MTTGSSEAQTGPVDTALSVSRFREAARVIREAQQTEALWFCQGDPRSPTNPWMPFQVADFLSIVFECVPEAAGYRFLDVGCGPGTKMLIASHFYGMDAAGIEIDPAMARAARAHGSVVCGDALQAPPGAFGTWDVIWLYRPFRDRDLERQLEKRIMDEMKPGAILAGGGWETCPADRRWITVVDDWELRRGAWMKPVLQRLVTDIPLPQDLCCQYEHLELDSQRPGGAGQGDRRRHRRGRLRGNQLRAVAGAKPCGGDRHRRPHVLRRLHRAQRPPEDAGTVTWSPAWAWLILTLFIITFVVVFDLHAYFAHTPTMSGQFRAWLFNAVIGPFIFAVWVGIFTGLTFHWFAYRGH